MHNLNNNMKLRTIKLCKLEHCTKHLCAEKLMYVPVPECLMKH